MSVSLFTNEVLLYVPINKPLAPVRPVGSVHHICLPSDAIFLTRNTQRGREHHPDGYPGFDGTLICQRPPVLNTDRIHQVRHARRYGTCELLQSTNFRCTGRQKKVLEATHLPPSVVVPDANTVGKASRVTHGPEHGLLHSEARGCKSVRR